MTMWTGSPPDESIKQGSPTHVLMFMVLYWMNYPFLFLENQLPNFRNLLPLFVVAKYVPFVCDHLTI